MKRTSPAIVAALAFTFAPFAVGHAAAQQASGPAHQLDSFVGDGVCTGNMNASGKNPAHATTGKFHGELTLDGHWAVMHYDEDRTAANPKPFSVAQYVGYDPAKKQFVTVLFDNSGSSYGTGVSAGWKGDTISFDEAVTIEGKPASFRDVFTNGPSGMSTHTGMMRDKDGKWVKTDVETCRKP